MRLSERAEEILENLWVITQETNKESVSFKELKINKDAPEIEELLS